MMSDLQPVQNSTLLTHTGQKSTVKSDQNVNNLSQNLMFGGLLVSICFTNQGNDWRLGSH